MQGNIAEIIGAAVDVQFPPDAVPCVYDALAITGSGLIYGAAVKFKQPITSENQHQ